MWDGMQSRTPKWVLELPSEGICQGDSVLREAYAGARAEASYENLCKLYVGLTRARYGLYVIAPEPSKSSPNFSKLLQQTLELDLEELPPCVAPKAGVRGSRLRGKPFGRRFLVQE